MPGSAHTSAPSVELCLNPEECGKANEWEREHEGPNCPVAGVAERLRSQTVKRICVTTLVRGPCCDVGSCKTEASGAADIQISPTCCRQPHVQSLQLVWGWPCLCQDQKLYKLLKGLGIDQQHLDFFEIQSSQASCLTLMTLKKVCQAIGAGLGVLIYLFYI